MNVGALCEAVRGYLREIVADVMMPVENAPGALRAPVIVDGYLPPKRSTADPDFPFIIVRPSKKNIGPDRMGLAELKMIVGAYSEDPNGYLHAVNVIELIERRLLERPTIPGTVFRFELPFEWQLYDDQAYPYFQLDATSRWTVATPIEQFDEGDI